MHKILLLIVLTLIVRNLLPAQTRLAETEKLAATAKVWGFLKYYHPKVADGKYNWDEQLFNVLPEIRKTYEREQLSEILIDWIDRLGEVQECKKCDREKNQEYFDKNFNLLWIDDQKIFTSELSEKLRFIQKHRHQGEKYYYTIREKIRNNNEPDYQDFDWKDENLRLLSLFRYWNIIEYFFPYKYQTDINWDEVLNAMIPKFLYPETEMEFHLAMLELIVSIDDSHAGFASKKTWEFFGFYWISAIYRLIDNKAVITGFYNDSLARIDDLKVGDVITKVNNKNIETIFNEKEKYIHGSNLARKKLNAHFSIFNGTSDSVKIEFERDGKMHTKSIKRYLLQDLNYIRDIKKDTYKILDGNIGYVNMGTLKRKEVPDVMKALQNTKALIFDIRNYPNSTLYLISKYISSSRNDFYKAVYFDPNYPGKFIWRDGRQCGANKDLKYKGKVVLLVNERSQSHAEFTIMCLQTGDNVTTIGSQTSGADGNISHIKMVDGYKTAFTGLGIFYPDRTETQRKGVKIDIEIKPTIKGIKKGRDKVLERAIKFIKD